MFSLTGGSYCWVAATFAAAQASAATAAFGTASASASAAAEPPKAKVVAGLARTEVEVRCSNLVTEVINACPKNLADLIVDYTISQEHIEQVTKDILKRTDFTWDRLKLEQEFGALAHYPNYARKRIALSIVSRDGNDLRYLPEDLRNDQDVAWRAAWQTPAALASANFPPARRKELAIYLMNRDGNNLRVLPPDLQDDPDVVWPAVRNNVLAFQYASKRLRANDELALFAVNEHPLMLQHVESLPDKRNMVLSAVKKNGWVVQDAGRFHPPYLKDEEIMAAAIRQNPSVVQLANIDLQKKLVPQLAVEAPRLKKFMATELQFDPIYLAAFGEVEKPNLKDEKIMEIAVRRNPDIIAQADIELQKKLALKLAAEIPRLKGHLSEELQNDPEILAAFGESPMKKQKT